MKVYSSYCPWIVSKGFFFWPVEPDLGTKKNYYSRGRNLLFYLFKEMLINLTAVIIEENHC
jgi:hypothetical protein